MSSSPLEDPSPELEQPSSAYVHGFAVGFGTVLLAGLVLAIIDVVHAGGAATALLGFWAVVALPVAAGGGVVLGAGNATWGNGWVRGAFRRLAADPVLDRKVVGVIVGGAVVAGVLVLGVGKLSVALVGDVQRKAVGGLLLGAVVVAAVPVLALASLPIFRLVYRVLELAPDVKPLQTAIAKTVGSRTVLLMVGAVVVGAAVVYKVLFGGLDTEALNLGSLVMLALLPVLAIANGILFYATPLAKVRELFPRRAGLAGVGAMIAISLAYIAIRTKPNDETIKTVTEASYLGPRIVPVLRKLIDHDGDGYSAFFGGDDCDDNDAAVHPGADEIPDNNKDDNCVGGDAHKPREAPLPEAGKPAPVAVAQAVSGGDNVLVIFVDTLRADRVGFAGYQRDGKSLTPHLDALAKDGVVFTRAFSQAPNTPRSVPSFLSSRYPSQVKVDKVFKPYPTVLDDNDLLFEAMKGAGFATIGESSHFFFCDRKKYPDTCDTVVSWMNSNITQGADLWDNTGALNIPESNHDSAGPRIVDKADKKLEELAKAKTKFSMIVHLFEPHSTYMVHDGFTRDGVDYGKITEHGSAALAQKYDYEVAYADEQLGKLLATLDATGLAKTTTVVLMADHGEAFGVHVIAGKPDFFHGDSLYAELIHVPLVFRVPGGKACKRDEVVQLVDLSPTIAAIMGVKAPASWQGRSLAPALACDDKVQLPGKPAFSELLPAPDWDHAAKSMVTPDGFHVYWRSSDNRWEVYDLSKDPDEKTDIADGNPKLEAWKQELAAWIEGPLAAGGGK